jgi:hypothetical protein
MRAAQKPPPFRFPGPHLLLDVVGEEGDQGLRQRVAEHQLGADDEDLQCGSAALALGLITTTGKRG